MSDELVTVFRAGDSTQVIMAKAALDAEQIRYIVRGDLVQDYIGWGRLPTGMNVVTGPTSFQVTARDADRARAAVKSISRDSDDGVARPFVPPPSWYWQKRGLLLLGLGFMSPLLTLTVVSHFASDRVTNAIAVVCAVVPVIAGLTLIGVGLRVDALQARKRGSSAA